MKEIVLFIIVLTILFASQFLLRKIRKPLLHYIRIIAAILLLILIIFFAENTNVYTRGILFIIALGSILREVIRIKNFTVEN